MLSCKTRQVKHRAATALRMGANSLCRAKGYFGEFFRRMRLSSAQPRRSPPPHIKSHEFSITSYRRKNPTQKQSSTFTMSRHVSEPKCASANKPLGSASNSCRSLQQDNDN